MESSSRRDFTLGLVFFGAIGLLLYYTIVLTGFSFRESTQLTATARMSDGSQKNVTSAATWSGCGGLIASLTGGRITGLLPGICTVSASFEGKTDSMSVTVTATGSRWVNT